MPRLLEITITEGVEELEARLRRETQASSQERLQMLYWLKQGLVSSRQELTKLLNRSEATITRWLKHYRQGGLATLLEVGRAPGRARSVPPEVMTQLKQRLEKPEGFVSYRAIWQWLNQECGVAIAYKTVYKLVRYELQAKLKVPRPRHHKQAPEAIEQFKKTLPLP